MSTADISALSFNGAAILLVLRTSSAPIMVIPARGTPIMNTLPRDLAKANTEVSTRKQVDLGRITFDNSRPDAWRRDSFIPYICS